MKEIKKINIFKIFKNIVFSIRIIRTIKKYFFLKKIINMIINSLLIFTVPLILKRFLHGIENNLSIDEIIYELLFLSIFCMMTSIIECILKNSINYDIEVINTKLLKQFNESTIKIDYEFLERPEIQDMYELANASIKTYSGMFGLTMQFIDVLGYIISFLISGIIIVEINVYFVFIVIAVSLLKIYLEKNKQKIRSRNLKEKLPPHNRRIIYCNSVAQNIGFAKDVRLYDVYNYIKKERNKSVKNYMGLVDNNHRISFIFYFLVYFLNFVLEVSMYIFLVLDVVKGMPISDFTFSIASVTILISMISKLVINYGNIYKSSLSVDDYISFSNFFDMEDSVGQDIDLSTFNIEFKNVYYKYYLQDDYALEDVSFTIKNEDKIALLGINGAGKTTLVKLICGLYKPTKGEIYINGVNITDIRKECLWRAISPVFQDLVLFPFTILENIIDNDDLDINKINNVIRLVGLEEKIKSLKSGYDTILSRNLYDEGIDLSGGESQRILIAKAIYKKSSLIILDEPTSALDPLAEASFYENFDNIINRRTTIFITHRLSATKFCDKILMFENGKLIEAGNHFELMQLDTLYKKLFETQSKLYQEVKND
ncbi:MAG TPA: ABC transporter ATP-binding protein [Bacilli bacterium]|nr:ABC transporter ATP-binding protein [Bacilli bacterium]NLT02218.1 ABC transporter ATP-binding protein [Acholeplasmataceae bacterium]HNZ77535.1 ABC transporter ATP-binding protein [Bacilli bacterium]HOD61066.1 ABC transporter ATP-binding protein [Bacilli bacterium]HOH61406.1 ABC transporter ATP-binding protein [Bacilli bacterium]